jgi:putative ABC transport system permease protein
MIRSYLIIAIRQIWRHPFFSIINVLGLSLSFSIGLMIMSLINYQLRYDTFHPDKERIFRITTTVTGKGGEKVTYATTPLVLKDELFKYQNHFDAICQFRSVNDAAFEYKDKKLDFKAIFTSPKFFSVFGFTINNSYGVRSFDEPNTAVVSQDAAQRIFGTTAINGAIIHSNSFGDYKIVGILNPSPGLTHINYDILLSDNSSMNTLKGRVMDSSLYKWSAYYSGYTYVKIKKGEPLSVYTSIFREIVKGSFFKQNYPMGEQSVIYNLQPILEITPRRAILLDNSSGMSYSSIVVLIIFVFVLILMACLNYANLTMARILSRHVEVGMRKIFGASRKQVITQFVIEATIICFLALVFAFLFQPYIPLNEQLRRLVVHSHIDAILIMESILIAICAGVFSGILPSFIFSKLRAIDALRNRSGLNLFKAISFQKIIIFFQFVISFVLVSVLMTTYKQSKFMASADYGFFMKNTITLSVNDSSQRVILKNEFKKLPFVKNVSAISDNFGSHATDLIDAKVDASLPIKLSEYSVDENIQPAMALKLIAGRNFNPENNGAEKFNILINRKACELFALGAPQDAINKTLVVSDSINLTIIGVLDNFHYENFKQPIGAMALRYDLEASKFLNIQLSSELGKQQLDQLDAVWKKIVPFSPFRFVFFEDQLHEQQSHIDDILMMAFLCIVFISIGCLGLLGISTYAIEIKSKEISIRKIVGASTLNIFIYFSKQYLVLLMIASLVGIPIGQLGSNYFLRNFAYKHSDGIINMFQSFLIVFIIAFMSFGIQIFRSSMASPIKNIR